MLDNRLNLGAVNLDMLQNLVSPIVSIAMLGMIESLLCGASASRMKDEAFDADRELIAQGVGNILLPFFGGVPATAAIARTSVAIKSGEQTRVTGVVHSLVLLLAMVLLGGVMSRLPLSALAGVLMVTAHITLLAELFPGIVLPGLYATLSTIAGRAYGDEIGATLRALVGYGVAIAALIALMAARVHRMDLRFEGRE